MGAVAALAFAVFAGSFIPGELRRSREGFLEIRKDGYRARKANIPPEACPHLQSQREREQWLRGWNDAALEGKP